MINKPTVKYTALKSRLFKNLLLLICYIFTARVCLLFDTSGGFLAPVWGPTGISVAALFIFGFDLWPGVFLGGLISDAITGAPISIAIFTGLGGALESVIGAYILKFCSFDRKLARVSDVTVLLVASILGAAVSSTIGVVALYTGGLIAPDKVYFSLLNWWGGDLTGNILFASLIFIFSSGVVVEKRKWYSLEALICVTAAVVQMCFLFNSGPNSEYFPKTYLVFPILLWAAVRFEQLGALVGVFILYVISIWRTTMGLGPFALHRFSMGLLNLQLFLAVSAITTSIVAALRAQTQVAIRVRDEFVAVASHEIKNPLTAVKLELDFIKRMFRTKPKDVEISGKVESRLDNAINQIGRIAILVDDILDVTRIEAGKLTFSFEWVNLCQLTQDVVNEYSAQLAAADCNVEINVNKNIAGYWDPLRIEQIIINLITNAIKYAPGTQIKISATTYDNRVNFVFQDLGPGIDKDNQQKLFNRFERMNQSSRKSGLGLGLYIVKQIAEGHHGSITIKSEKGRGSQFIIDLPVNPVAG